jgi:adenylate cyclase
VDKVSVRGKQRGTVIHELLGLSGEVGAEKVTRAEACRDAFQKYLDRRWREAAAILDGILREHPGDKAAVILRDRCVTYQAEPPPGDWTGVFRVG